MPDDFGYILSCKLMAGRPDKDFNDIATLCQLLRVTTRAQAQAIVDRFFPSKELHRLHLLPSTLALFFPDEEGWADVCLYGMLEREWVFRQKRLIS